MSNAIDRLETLWCRYMHNATMWPIHGRYRCGTCLRDYPVPFETRTERGFYRSRSERTIRTPNTEGVDLPFDASNRTVTFCFPATRSAGMR